MRSPRPLNKYHRSAKRRAVGLAKVRKITICDLHCPVRSSRGEHPAQLGPRPDVALGAKRGRALAATRSTLPLAAPAKMRGTEGASIFQAIAHQPIETDMRRPDNRGREDLR